jgi:hypothetical protein
MLTHLQSGDEIILDSGVEDDECDLNHEILSEDSDELEDLDDDNVHSFHHFHIV